MQDFDSIIIGSGINSLVAGALLSRARKKVLIIERSESFGGCMSTEEVTLPGFKHDVMAATFVLFSYVCTLFWVFLVGNRQLQ